MAGRTLDDLKLTNQPLPQAEDPRGTEWYQYVQYIEDLLATGRYTFAEDTLRGIQQSVEKAQKVTDGQRRAVDNIEQSAYRTRRGGSRRYEGFR